MIKIAGFGKIWKIWNDLQDLLACRLINSSRQSRLEADSRSVLRAEILQIETNRTNRKEIDNDKNCRIWNNLEDLERFVEFLGVADSKPTEGVSCGQKSYKSGQIGQIEKKQHEFDRQT